MNKKFNLKVEDYQYPGEDVAFATLKTLAPLGFIEELIYKYIGEYVQTTELFATSVKVSEKQFPRVNQIVHKYADILEVPPPDIYIKQNPIYNAYTSGIKEPFIVLHSSLVDAFNEKELISILCHELGHIKSQHVKYILLARAILDKSKFLPQNPILQIIEMGLVIALFKWYRLAEHTADRVAYLASGDISSVTESLVKLVLGSQKLFAELDMREYLKQTKILDDRELVTMLLSVYNDHPFAPFRVRELLRFASSQQGKDLIRKILR